MSSEEIKNLQQLITLHKRRLQILEEQKARFGVSVDPHISMEIGDIQAEVAHLEQKIRNLRLHNTSASINYDTHSILIDIYNGDVRLFDCDVLALKFAQALYGVDRIVAEALEKIDLDITTMLPVIDAYKVFNSFGRIKPRQVLFVSVDEITQFKYAKIRSFTERSLEVLSMETPNIRHLAMTLHGIEYGLHESRVLHSQLTGCFDAFDAGRFPPKLERITIVEINEERANRLADTLGNTLLTNPIPIIR
jgi:hypothetical protein